MTVGLLAAIADLAAPGDSLAAAGGQPGALGLLMFSAGTHVIAMSGLFLVLSYLSREDHDVEYADELMGLGQLAPKSAAVLMTLVASLICLPPFMGFWSNWLMTVAAFNVRSAVGRDEATPHDGLMLLIAVAIIATLMSAGVAVRISQFVVLESPISRHRPQGSRSAIIVAGVCSVMLLIGGLAPARLLSAVSSIRGPGKISTPDLPSGPSRGQSTAQR
jgi:NADH:ubiquinone oxidoreductase subunit 2 (subunit N)